GDLLGRRPGRRDRARGQRLLGPASHALQRAAAFFDLDKTLMAGSSGMQFARVATRHGIIGRRQLASWAVEHLRYRLRGTTDARTEEVLRVARDLITGVPVRSLERLNPEVMAAILPRVYPQMLEEVYAHQDAGRATFIVSAAGNGVVSSLSQVLGMDGGIGTSYEAADGVFTGRFEGPFVYGKGKVKAMEEFAAEHGIDLADSYAYSDSLSDLPMLRAVGNPVVVNPDPELARIAREEGWQAMCFERLGRRIVALAITALATVAGFGARHVAARRRVPPPRRFPVRR
ncbi:MAG TPA: HAD family hydrolase, partial [Solirubrobacterales bacterium]